MKTFATLLAASLLSGASAAPSLLKRQSTVPIMGTTTPSTVTLPCGVVDVLGQTNTQLNVSSYLSIPFAQAPVGDLRFAAPQTYVYAPGTVNATTQKAACPQIPSNGLAGTFGFSEDCLTLDVYTPAGVTNTSSLPVWVFVYGGGFIEGTSGTYDASGIIAESMQTESPFIFVAMNYRVGIWGWMQGREAAMFNASNLGLLDQLEAVNWVKTNIASFGGNPDHIVIGGQSAGAISTSLHLLNPNINATDIFKGVILESGSPDTYPITNTNTSRQATFDQIANMTGCAANASMAGPYESDAYATAVFQCLKYVDEAVLANATFTVLEEPQNVYGNYQFGPSIDGRIIPADPATLIAEGKYAKLPMIDGDNLDEGGIFVNPTVSGYDQQIAFLKLVTPVAVNETVAETLLSFYQDVSQDDPFEAGNQTSFAGFAGNVTAFRQLASVEGDVSFNAPRRAFIKSNIANGNDQVWSYLFSQPPVNQTIYGVAHGNEVVYVFLGPVVAPASYPAGAGMLSEQMGNYWINFINTLNPNGAGPIASIVASKLNSTEWPMYSSGAGANQLQLQIGNTTVIQDTYRSAAFDYINSLGPAIAH